MKFQELLDIARIANPGQSEVWLKTFVAYFAVSQLTEESFELAKKHLAVPILE